MKGYDESTCLHEAGHAVAAHHFGWAVDEVSARWSAEQPGAAGFVRLKGLCRDKSLQKCATYAFAGEIAERVVGGYDPYETVSGMRDDLKVAVLCHSVDKKVNLDKASDQAESIINRHRGPVRALATRLQMVGRMDGDDVHQLLNEHMGRTSRPLFICFA